MKNILAYLFITLILFATSTVKAQDPQYSQSYSNLLLLNPAFTGSGIGPRLAINWRAQWAQIPGFYKQYAAAFDMPVEFLGTTQGVGVLVNADVAGEGNLTKINLLFNYAYQVDINDDHTLRFGLSGGITHASIDFFRLRFPDQIDPRNGFSLPTNEPGLLGGLNQSVVRPDVNAGVAYFNEYVWLGFSAHHITQPVEQFYVGQSSAVNVDARLPIKYTLTGGVRIPVRKGGRNRGREVSIVPTFLIKQQGEFTQVDGGLYLNADPMVFGVWYRHQDAVIGLIGLKTGPFSFGYSYDYTVSELTQNASGGSHEISLLLEFEQYRKRKRRKHRKIPCPRF